LVNKNIPPKSRSLLAAAPRAPADSFFRLESLILPAQACATKDTPRRRMCAEIFANLGRSVEKALPQVKNWPPRRARGGKDCELFRGGNEWATLLRQSGDRTGPWARRAMPIVLEQAVVEKPGIFFRIRL
jgi:hypothetical protein